MKNHDLCDYNGKVAPFEDGDDAMWELEDAGAFSDEGIMPGCHSRDWEYECQAREVAKEFEYMDFVGNRLKNAREKINLSSEELAKILKLPENFVIDIESGQYISRYDNLDIKAAVTPLVENITDMDMEDKGQAKSKEKNKKKSEWWQACSDYEIREKIVDTLIKLDNNSELLNLKQEIDEKQEKANSEKVPW